MTMEPLTLRTALDLTWWRNKSRENLRTPGFTTEEGQAEWFRGINKPDSKIWYWEFREKIDTVAAGGFVNIDRHNRLAEISLLVSPNHRRKGYGKQAVALLLKEAFDNMNLVRVYGEVYDCGPGAFWEKAIPDFKWSISPHLKYWNGKQWGATFFWIDKND